MLMLFYFTEDVTVTLNEGGTSYNHKFDKIPNKDRNNIPSENIYFSTPSDFKTHMDTLRKTLPDEKLKEMIYVMPPHQVVAHKEFPKNIGFGNLEEQIDEFKGRPQITVAILNAMSNALGDHLIGMNAFNIFQEKIRSLLPGTNVSIILHQLNPYRTGAITKKWASKFQQVYMLPNRLSRLMEYDAIIDLGGLLLHKDFDKKPMMDFYLQALSVPPETVPVEQKRIIYDLPEENRSSMEKILRNVRAQKRPILLFHHRSTSQIRAMSDCVARGFIRDIIDKTPYFVISACGLEYQNKRFLSISEHSKTTDDFASIISQVDAIITVDTSTYHFADAFDIPTVVLFTTIDPSLRTPYYPFTKSIMLEDSDGMLFGRHKVNKAENKDEEEIAHIEKMWSKFDITEAIELLQSIGG